MSEFTCEDNMVMMARYPNKFFGLAVVDPPYGIYEDGNRDLKPHRGVARRKYHPALWSQKRPGREYWKELFRVSQNQIVWGGNYFTDFLPPSRHWIVWDKRDRCAGNDYADAELAWTSFTTSIRVFRWLWNGMLQADMKNKEDRIHPTQKPVVLYRWLLKQYAVPGQIILDTHVGSASSLVACEIEGFDYRGCDSDPVYFEGARRRLADFRAEDLETRLTGFEL